MSSDPALVARDACSVVRLVGRTDANDDEVVRTAASTAAGDSFAVRLVVVVLVALAARVTWVVVMRNEPLRYDGGFYHLLSKALADGAGFVEPRLYDETGDTVANANHVPAWPVLLTLPQLAGLESLLAAQLFACLVGGLTVVAMGLAGRVIGGPGVGIVAAVLTALYPSFWVHERELMSETLVLLLDALLVLAAYGFFASPTTQGAVRIGGLCGLLALTRPEHMLLVVAFCPLLLLARSVPRRRRFVLFAVSVVVALLVVLPWISFNATRFERPVGLTTAFGFTLSTGNCQPTYYGRDLGSGQLLCAAQRGFRGDASEQDARRLRRARSFIANNLDRVPIVVLAREGRTWAVFRPFDQVRRDAEYGSPLVVEQLRLFAYWLLAPLAAVGAWVLRRRDVSVAPLVSHVVLVALTVAVTFGDTRYRAPAEVSIVLLAAASLVHLAQRGNFSKHVVPAV
jgi:4-amino-4-deoxy-L-arabinose transferase-like glycosyltransferase